MYVCMSLRFVHNSVQLPETKVFSFSKYSSFDFDLCVEKNVVPGLLDLTGSTECEKVCDLKFYSLHTEERLVY